MATLINLSLNLANLPKEKMVKGKKGTYINLTVGVNDETKFGNNVSAYIAQSKEERQAKTQRQYVGNGKVVWTDGKVELAEKEMEAQPQAAKQEEFDDDLPF